MISVNCIHILSIYREEMYMVILYYAFFGNCVVALSICLHIESRYSSVQYWWQQVNAGQVWHSILRFLPPLLVTKQRGINKAQAHCLGTDWLEDDPRMMSSSRWFAKGRSGRDPGVMSLISSAPRLYKQTTAVLQCQLLAILVASYSCRFLIVVGFQAQSLL